MSLSRPEFDIVVMEDVMIPARDGVGLATDIYRPAQNGKVIETPLPIILERTPYNKRALDRVERNARYFARRGYIFAFQDCRACFRSEGQFDFFWQEGPDGYETVEWLAKQPWSNGKIGTTGTSYAGWTQNSLAVLNPEHLTCMWVNEGASIYLHCDDSLNRCLLLTYALLHKRRLPSAQAFTTIHRMAPAATHKLNKQDLQWAAMLGEALR